MAAQNRYLKADEYRRLASAADASAEASLLEHVREKHERAAARWMELALMSERPLQSPSDAAQSFRQIHSLETAE